MAFTWVHSSDMETLTRDKTLPKLSDAVGDASPLLGDLIGDSGTGQAAGKGKPMTKLTFGGGKRIEKIVRARNLSGITTYRGHSLVSTDPTQTSNPCYQDFAGYSCPISISRQEAQACRGDEAKVNLMTSKIAEAIATVKTRLATSIYNADTDLVLTERFGINGVGQLCGKVDLSGAARAWMGITSAAGDMSYWGAQSDVTAHAAADLPDSDSPHYIVKIIRNVVRNCTKMNQKPTAIYTTKTIYDILMDAARMNQRFVSSATADLGFVTLAFEGIPVKWDTFCPDYHAYPLNLSLIDGEPSLGIQARTGGWFDLTDWVNPADQHVQVRHLVVDCNLYCDNPRLQGGLTHVGG